MNLQIKKENEGEEYAFNDSDIESDVSEIDIQRRKRISKPKLNKRFKQYRQKNGILC